MTDENTRCPLGIPHIELYVANVIQASYYFQTGFGFVPDRCCPAEAEHNDRISCVLKQRKIKLVLTGPLTESGPIATHVQRHGDAVRDIALIVPNVRKAFTAALSNGATGVMTPHNRQDRKGGGVTATIGVYGDIVHTFVESVRECTRVSPVEDQMCDLVQVDHLAVVLERGTLDRWFEFYVEVLGFQPTYQQVVTATKSGMRSKAVSSANGAITLTLIEPVQGEEASQIDEFLRYNNGPGIQHVAFQSENIFTTLQAFRKRHIRTVRPVEGYYERLKTRVGSALSEQFENLEQLGIFADRDDDGSLLQSFTMTLGNRPTFFFEILERRGSRLFGAANVQALFEALEREQSLRRNPS
jgi:4-hydroxyphenylpyruvate dioxygenase